MKQVQRTVAATSESCPGRPSVSDLLRLVRVPGRIRASPKMSVDVCCFDWDDDRMHEIGHCPAQLIPIYCCCFFHSCCFLLVHMADAVELPYLSRLEQDIPTGSKKKTSTEKKVDLIVSHVFFGIMPLTAYSIRTVYSNRYSPLS